MRSEAREVNPLKEDLWVRERRAWGPPSLAKIAASSACLVSLRQSRRSAFRVSGSRDEERRFVQHLMAV